APDGACDAHQARAKDKALAHAKREAAQKGLAATGALLSAGRRRGTNVRRKKQSFHLPHAMRQALSKSRNDRTIAHPPGAQPGIIINPIKPYGLATVCEPHRRGA